MMKKIIVLFILSFFACLSLQAKKLFVEMEFNGNSIKLDDGSNKKRQAIKGKDGKDLKFTTLIGALNYMSLQGWELVETKSVTTGVGVHGSGTTHTQVYYIFSRDVTDEELEKVVSESYKKD